MPTYDPLAGVGSAISAYCIPPSDESPRIPLNPAEPLQPSCPDCGMLLFVGERCPRCVFGKPAVKIDPPPPYAADVETAAIDALGKLSPEQASRVVAWACSRFGVPGPIIESIVRAYAKAGKRKGKR